MRLIIYGAGGMGRDLLTAARQLDSVAFADDSALGMVSGIPVLRPDELGADDEVVLSMGDGATRRRVAERLRCRFGSLIAPTAVIGRDVSIGEGAAICDLSIITASTCIGRHFQCNVHCYVAHDCIIGDYVTFAPRASCNGNVHIGDGAFIGSGAVIRNGRPGRPTRIGAGAIVGMGAVVVGDVAPGATVVGNPARGIG